MRHNGVLSNPHSHCQTLLLTRAATPSRGSGLGLDCFFGGGCYQVFPLCRDFSDDWEHPHFWCCAALSPFAPSPRAAKPCTLCHRQTERHSMTTAIVGTVITAAALGITLYVSREAYLQGSLFSWHPFCMSLGALGLSTAGIQAVRSRRRVQGIQPKTQRVQVRMSLLLAHV